VTQANRTQLLRGIAFVPGLVTGIEGQFASKSGEENKDAAMSFPQNVPAFQKRWTETVECVNASTWYTSPSLRFDEG
jgi:hypothetical protein